MGKSDRMTEEELDYIRSVYPELGPSAIARNLGRSLSAVKSRIKEMGLKKPDNQISVVRFEPKSTIKDYDRLVELRDILHQRLTEASPSAIAAISKEYRAVLQDIESLESKNSSDQDNPLEQLAKKIANGM